MPLDQAGFDIGAARVLSPEEAADLKALRFIRDHLKQRSSWCQGKLWDGNGAHCVIGWVYAAFGYQFESDNRMFPGIDQRNGALNMVCRLQSEVPWHMQLFEYNDARATRKRQIQNLVDRAIAKLEGA